MAAFGEGTEAREAARERKRAGERESGDSLCVREPVVQHSTHGERSESTRTIENHGESQRAERRGTNCAQSLTHNGKQTLWCVGTPQLPKVTRVVLAAGTEEFIMSLHNADSLAEAQNTALHLLSLCQSLSRCLNLLPIYLYLSVYCLCLDYLRL